MFCRSLFVLLYFFFWPLCCLSFFDMRILITPLVSSNSSVNTLCQLRSDDERWYWYLCFGSRLTIVSLLCLPVVLCATCLTIKCWIFHRTSFIHMTTFTSRWMKMICIKIKISTLGVLYNNATHPVTVKVLLFVDAHFRASSKLPGIVWGLTFYSHCRKHLVDCIVS